MAHNKQERWSKLVDAKLRQTLVTKDRTIFNNRYEGNPKAGKVKIPVRDTEVEVKAYNKSTGVDLSEGSTSYIDLNIDQDEAVNELIDGYDAAAVPDNLVADRLDEVFEKFHCCRSACSKKRVACKLPPSGRRQRNPPPTKRH